MGVKCQRAVFNILLRRTKLKIAMNTLSRWLQAAAKAVCGEQHRLAQRHGSICQPCTRQASHVPEPALLSGGRGEIFDRLARQTRQKSRRGPGRRGLARFRHKRPQTIHELPRRSPLRSIRPLLGRTGGGVDHPSIRTYPVAAVSMRACRPALFLAAGGLTD